MGRLFLSRGLLLLLCPFAASAALAADLREIEAPGFFLDFFDRKA
jgi:hypothetical protein